MSDLLAEVDEIMRQEKMVKFWKENGPYIIAFVVLTIVLTAAISGYRAWDNSVKTKQTAELIELMRAPNYPGNIVVNELDFRAPLRAVALMGAAGSFMSQEKPEDAYKLYARVAEDNAIKPEFRHLAILMTVRMDMDKENADADALLERLKPVLSKKSLYQAQGQVDAALINASLKKDYNAAIALLGEVLEEKDLPPSLYERAQNLHHIYSLQINEPKSEDEEDKQAT